MSWFEKIKYYYEHGLWDKQRVRNVVGKVLTAEEYNELAALLKAAANE